MVSYPAGVQRTFLHARWYRDTLTPREHVARRKFACAIPITQPYPTVVMQCITHLDEDALLLWQTAVRNTVTIESVNGAPALIDLFPLLMSLLTVNLDLLGKIIGIMESYFLLGAQVILQVYF
jgi:hypothetical protein